MRCDARLTPFVSILVPTANRRIFIPQLIRCYYQQDYPAERTELLVLDDGMDPVGDLFEGVPGVRYRREAAPRSIGAKRNILAATAVGDILVHMDDDDYYPPGRVSHAVRSLLESGAELAGSSRMPLLFVATGKLADIGPFGRFHATANTLAYRRAYLETHRFDDASRRAEESAFTRGFTEPMVQLDPLKTIVHIVHNANTAAKRSVQVRPMKKRLKDLIAHEASLFFYRYHLKKLLGMP